MNSMTRILSRGLAVSLLAILAACSESGDGVLYKDDLPTVAAPEAPAPAPGPGNIVEVASEAGSFSTLITAVEAAGLVDALSDGSASLCLRPLMKHSQHSQKGHWMPCWQIPMRLQVS